MKATLVSQLTEISKHRIDTASKLFTQKTDLDGSLMWTEQQGSGRVEEMEATDPESILEPSLDPVTEAYIL